MQFSRTKKKNGRKKINQMKIGRDLRQGRLERKGITEKK